MADLASQRAIRALIVERRPDDAFVAEEEGADDAGSSGLRSGSTSRRFLVAASLSLKGLSEYSG